jgi:hypothetical protein
MGRDHSIKCVVCGSMRGGLDDLECACEQPYVALVHGLATLAHNLAVAGALRRAYDLGWEQCLDSEHIADSYNLHGADARER